MKKDSQSKIKRSGRKKLTARDNREIFQLSIKRELSSYEISKLLNKEQQKNHVTAWKNLESHANTKV